MISRCLACACPLRLHVVAMAYSHSLLCQRVAVTPCPQLRADSMLRIDNLDPVQYRHSLDVSCRRWVNLWHW